MALQRHAKVIWPHLHAELSAEVFADLSGRDLVAKRLDSTQSRIAQRYLRFRRSGAAALPPRPRRVARPAASVAPVDLARLPRRPGAAFGAAAVASSLCA